MNAPASTLKDRITDDMKSAMRARETLRLGAIRMLLAAVKQREVDERIILDDAQVAAIVDKLIKQRRDSIAQFEQAGRIDLVDQEKAELAVLSLAAAIATTGAAGPQDMGKVMALLKSRLAGRADLTAVSAMVKSRLAAR